MIYRMSCFPMLVLWITLDDLDSSEVNWGLKYFNPDGEVKQNPWPSWISHALPGQLMWRDSTDTNKKNTGFRESVDFSGVSSWEPLENYLIHGPCRNKRAISNPSKNLKRYDYSMLFFGGVWTFTASSNFTHLPNQFRNPGEAQLFWRG